MEKIAIFLLALSARGGGVGVYGYPSLRGVVGLKMPGHIFCELEYRWSIMYPTPPSHYCQPHIQVLTPCDCRLHSAVSRNSAYSGVLFNHGHHDYYFGLFHQN